MTPIGKKNGRNFYYQGVEGVDRFYIWWEPKRNAWCLYGEGSEEYDYHPTLKSVQSLLIALKS